MKITSGFRGIILELAVRLNNSPIRCKKLATLPLGVSVLWGKLVAVKKKYTIGIAKEKSMGGEEMEWYKALVEWIGAKLVAWYGWIGETLDRTGKGFA